MVQGRDKGGVPPDFDSFVAQYERLVVWMIRHVSRGKVHPEDLLDLKQMIYLRIWEKQYLDRCRVLIAERGGGEFSTYLYWLVRSVCANYFKYLSARKRRGMLHAKALLDPRENRYHLPMGTVHPERVPGAFEDLEFEERLLADDALRRLGQFIATTQEGADLARVLQLAYEGYTAPEIGRVLGTKRAYTQRLLADLRGYARTLLAG